MISNGDYTGVKVAYITGSLFFGNLERLTKSLDNLDEDCKTLIISARGLSHADSSAVHALREFGEASSKKGIKVYFTGLQENIRTAFLKNGLDEVYDKELVMWSTDEALRHIGTK